jgi:serine phosphatase RsbU (regulator of sigma subunit)
VIKKNQLPKQVVWAVIAISALPFLLHLLRVDFDSTLRLFDFAIFSEMGKHQRDDALFHSLAGAFIHTILEWSAFCAAIFTAVLSFVYFQIKGDIVTPIIGVALFFAGSMDAFHILISDRLIETNAESYKVMIFTWTVCRLFNPVILIIGASIFLVSRVKKYSGNLAFIAIITLGFGMMFYAIIHYALTGTFFPQSIFPDALITRPWDALSLLLFIVAGLFVLPRFYQRYPSLFSHSLIISMIPAIGTQLHMSFGSKILFDDHFNMAHFLKIVSYVVPFLGLSVDYIDTYRQEEVALKTIALNEKLKAENLRMGAELNVARQIQQMILPKPEELEIEGLDIAGYMEPADEVGGDYYDVLYTDGIVTIGIGDVTGHGLESGLLMLMVQTAVRTLKEVREHDPVRFLDTLNRTIYKNVQRMNSEKNLTLAILNYAEGAISISGQHEETIVVRKEGQIERIDTMDLGLPIGLDDDIVDFISHTIVKLQPGDGVVVYTDGIPEAKDMDKKQYGIEPLCEVISHNWHKSASEIKNAIIADVRQFIGNQRVFDDITLLVLKRQDAASEDTQNIEKGNSVNCSRF